MKKRFTSSNPDLPHCRWILNQLSHQRSPHMSYGRYQWKCQWDTTTHLLKWPKSTTLPPPNADEDVDQQELALMVGIQNGTPTLEDSLAVSYETEHTLTNIIQQSQSLVFTQMNWKFTSTQKPALGRQSSFIHNLQNSKANKRSFGMWMDNELWNIHPIGYYLREFPGGPVVTIPLFHWCEPGFSTWPRI